MIKSLVFLISLFLLLQHSLFTTVAEAKSSLKADGWGTLQGNEFPVLSPEQVEKIDKAEADASAALLNAAKWIDSFFDDGRFTSEENKTRATVKMSFGYSKNDDFELKPDLDIRLNLPILSKRLNLFIEAAGDQDFNVGRDPNLGPPHDTSNDSQFTAGLRYFLQQTQKSNFSYDAGLSWTYAFTGVRYRVVNDLGDWLGRFTDRVRYYTDHGWENKASYDFEKKLSTKLFFRTTTSVSLYEEEEGLPHSQYFRLFQILSSYQALSYEAGVYADTRPSYKMTDTQFILRYRQRFFRDWLILEVSPRVSFPEDHDREMNPGIILSLEAAFGYKPDEEGYNKIFR